MIHALIGWSLVELHPGSPLKCTIPIDGLVDNLDIAHPRELALGGALIFYELDMGHRDGLPSRCVRVLGNVRIRTMPFSAVLARSILTPALPTQEGDP